MTKLTKKDLRKGWLSWAMFHLSSMSFEKLQAHGFAQSMIPVLKRLYKDNPEEYKKGLIRHSAFYNAEPHVGSIVNGIVTSMEEEKANGKEINDEMFVSVKTSAMGPISAIGDSTIQGVLIPILLTIGMSVSSDGNPLGVLLYILGFGTMGILISYFMFMRGYSLGTKSMNIISGDNSKGILGAFETLGILVIGGLAASFVSLTTPLMIPNGDEFFVLQETLDSFFPGLLGLLAVIFSWYLISKRKVKATNVLLILIGITVIGVLVGVF